MEQKAWSEGDRIGAANIIRTCRKLSAYKPPMNAMQWSEKTRRMEGGRSYRFGFAPYQREMMETPFRPDVQITAFQMASRLGKTEVCMNILGHAIDAQPRKVLWLWPTTSQATKWSKETFERELCEPTPELRWLVRGGRRQSDNTILHRAFPGGLLHAFGSNSPGEIRRAKGNLLVADEIDAHTTNKSDEGDALEIFWVRGSEFHDTCRIACSYPSLVGHSRIARLMEDSDYRKWHVPCPRCKEPIVMLREHLRWTPGEPENAIVICPECEGEFNDKERRAAVAKGEWIATKPFKGTAGFWGSGMLSPHPVQRGYKSHLHWVAQQTEAAEKAANPDRARRVLVNTFDAMPFQGRLEEKPDPADLVWRREKFNPVDQIPSGCLVIYWGADVQGDRLEVEFVGFGENDETWGLGYVQVFGSPLKSDTWRAFEKTISRKWQHPTLGEMGARGGCIDSRYQSAKVRQWTRGKQTRGIFAIVGSTILGKIPVGTPKKMQKPPVLVYELGTHEIKDVIYQRLDLIRAEGETTWPQGYMHYPAVEEYNQSYFTGLTIEDSIMKKGPDGNDYRWFEKPKGSRNEPLDVRVYAMAAKMIARPNLPMLARRALAPDAEEKPRPKKKRPRSWKLRGF